MIKLRTYIPAYWQTEGNAYKPIYTFNPAKDGEECYVAEHNILRIAPGYCEPTDDPSRTKREKTPFFCYIYLAEKTAIDGGSGGNNECIYVKGTLDEVGAMCGFGIQRKSNSTVG